MSFPSYVTEPVKRPKKGPGDFEDAVRDADESLEGMATDILAQVNECYWDVMATLGEMFKVPMGREQLGEAEVYATIDKAFDGDPQALMKVDLWHQQVGMSGGPCPMCMRIETVKQRRLRRQSSATPN
jgi:hypothetical protein